MADPWSAFPDTAGAATSPQDGTDPWAAFPDQPRAQTTAPTPEGQGFWANFWQSAERERLSPSAKSSLDLIGLKLNTMDPQEFFTEQAEMQANLAALPAVDPATEEWSWEYLGSLLGGMPSQVAEQVPYIAGGAALGAAGGSLGGPLAAGGGALVGAGSGAALQDMSRTFADQLRAKGYDVTKREEWAKAYANTDDWESAYWYAARRAGAVGLLTGLTAKAGSVLAPKVALPAAGVGRTVGQKTAVAAAGAGIGAVGGGIQEAGGQLAGGGAITDPGAIVDEMVAGVLTEAPAMAAPSIIEGGKRVVGERSPRRTPRVPTVPEVLKAEMDPETGAVRLVDPTFDVDMSDPEVAAVAQATEQILRLAQDVSDSPGITNSGEGWHYRLDFDRIGNTQTARRLQQYLAANADTAVMPDRLLDVISRPLARPLPVDPNAPMPASMVRPHVGTVGNVPFHADLAEGRMVDGRETLVVRATEALPEAAVETLIARAQQDGYEAIAFAGDSPILTQVTAALGNEARPAEVDVRFGNSESLAAVNVPRAEAAQKPLSGWTTAPRRDVPKAMQSLTEKQTPQQIDATIAQLEATMQRLMAPFKLRKRIKVIRDDTLGNVRGRAKYWVPGDMEEARIMLNPAAQTTPENMWSTLMHEVGHIVMFDKLYRADTKTVLAVMTDFASWRLGVDYEVAAGRKAREISPSRSTTTQILDQFEAWNRKPGLAGDEAYQRYWTSFTEWFAQQTARWATTQERPLTVVDSFFSSLGRQLRRILERFYRATGLRFEPSRAVNTYLDAFLQDVTPEVFGSVYDKIERETRAANKKALRDTGAEYVEAFPQHAATGPSREIVLRLFGRHENETYRRGVKKSIREVEGTAAHADRIARVYEWGIGLYQLAEQNLHIRKLQLYKETLSLAEIFKNKFLNRSIATAKRMAKLKDLEAFHAAADDYGQMRYRSSEEIRKGVKRLPTEEELLAIFDTHKLEPQSREVFRAMIADYAFVLDELEGVRRLEIEKRMRKPGSAVDLAAAAEALQAMEAEMAALRAVPYVPQMRFGDYAVTVWALDGKGGRQRVWFSTDETQKAQLASVRELQQLYPEPAFEVVPSILAKDTIPMMGLPRPLLEAVAARVELSPTQKDFLRDLAYEQAPPQSFKHHLQKKSNLQGYSRDFTRAYASYFLHAGNWMAKARYGDELRSYVKGVQEEARLFPYSPKEGPRGNQRARIGNYMANHFQEWLNPKADFWRLKAASFFIALGFNPLSAFVNLTSVISGAYPVLGSGFGDKAALLALGRASTGFTQRFKSAKSDLTAAQMRMREELVREGVIDEGFAADLAGIAEGRNLLTRFPGWDQRFAKRQLNRGAQAFSWMMEKSSWMFTATEKAVRVVTANAAFDLALKYPQSAYVKEAIEGHHEQFQRLIRSGWNPVEAAGVVTARRAVQTSQGIYTRWARPRFMRGKGGTLFQFKAFQQNMLWMMWNNRGAAARTMLAFGLLGGMMAQPGMEDISEALKVIAYRLFGADFDLEREARAAIVEWADIDPDWIMHGTASHGFGLPGLLSLAGETIGSEWMQQVPNVDLSGRVSMGQVSPIPLEALMPTTDVDSAIAKAAERGSGAAFGLGWSVYRALTDLRNQDAWMKLVPAAFRNMPKAFEALGTGRLEGPTGAAMLTFDVRDPEQMLEVLAFGVGANPLRLTQEWRADRAVREVTEFWYLRQQMLLRQLAEAVRAQDKTEMGLVVEAIRAFNETIPAEFRSKRITPDMARQSVRARERRRVLMEENVPFRRSDRPLAPGIRELYVQPDVESAREVTAAR